MSAARILSSVFGGWESAQQIVCWTSAAANISGALMQTAVNQEEEEDNSPQHAMTATYYASAQSGHDMMRGGNDESSYELGLEDSTVTSTSIPPQTLAYNNQYMGGYPPAGWYAAPLPPTSHYNYHNPNAQQSMYPAYPPAYYGPSAPAAQYHHLHYPSNDASSPRQGRAKASFSNEGDEDLQFVLTGDRQRDLRNVLYYVRKNPSATLFDIDGKFLFLILLSTSTLIPAINLVALTLGSYHMNIYTLMVQVLSQR